MFNKNLFKNSKRIAIIFLIAVFGITGIISCSADSTQPSSSQESAPNPDNTGPTTPDEPAPTFPDNTYMTVYTPWRGENYPRVSWQDSETLLRMWKEMMSRKWPADGKRWYIKGRSYGN